MKKLIIAFLILFSVSYSYALTDNRFYATIEDFKNDKPIEGVEIIEGSWTIALGTESFKVKDANGENRLKLSKLPSNIFTYEGKLLRGYHNNCYYVLIDGPVCFYLARHQALLYERADGLHVKSIATVDSKGNAVASKVEDYYSDGIKGDINILTPKVMKDYLTQTSLLSEYENDKPKVDKKDSNDDKNSKKVNRNIKYINKINSKKS